MWIRRASFCMILWIVLYNVSEIIKMEGYIENSPYEEFIEEGQEYLLGEGNIYTTSVNEYLDT